MPKFTCGFKKIAGKPVMAASGGGAPDPSRWYIPAAFAAGAATLKAREDRKNKKSSDKEEEVKQASAVPPSGAGFLGHYANKAADWVSKNPKKAVGGAVGGAAVAYGTASPERRKRANKELSENSYLYGV